MTNQTSQPVCVRFAPSPTGALHIGGVRTALFNWLLARHTGGRFLLRIEDTDRARSTKESENQILDGLRWLGMDWDGDPWRQSERGAVYQSHIDMMLLEGKAYRCTCSAERLEQVRAEQKARKAKPKYDGHCREAGIGADCGEPFVVRIKVPDGGPIGFYDQIRRGEIVTERQELDDFIIQRSDGSPTYNFVVAVDDAEMGMTHVLRGDDHINNTPKQLLVYEALGLAPPKFGHMPLILGADKAPLSKRHGATSLEAFRNDGFLPEAIINYLARLGWSHGDQEIFSREELVEHFSLEKINKSSGVFDLEKFKWVNGHWIRERSPAEIAELLLPLLPEAWRERAQAAPEVYRELVASRQEKVRTLRQLEEELRFYFEEIGEYDPKAAKKAFKGEPVPVLQAVRGMIAEASDLEEATLEPLLKGYAEERELGFGKVANPVRLALTGVAVSPGIYDVIRLLGRERCLARLDAAIAHLEAQSG